MVYLLLADEVNGCLASKAEEWVQKLERLIQDKDLMNLLGENAREMIQQGTPNACGKRLADPMLEGEYQE